MVFAVEKESQILMITKHNAGRTLKWQCFEFTYCCTVWAKSKSLFDRNMNSRAIVHFRIEVLSSEIRNLRKQNSNVVRILIWIQTRVSFNVKHIFVSDLLQSAELGSPRTEAKLAHKSLFVSLLSPTEDKSQRVPSMRQTLVVFNTTVYHVLQLSPSNTGIKCSNM